MITSQSYRLSKNQLHTSHYPSTIIILFSNLPKKEKKKQKKKYQLSPLPHTHTHARNNFHPVRTQKSCGPEQHETISFHETYIIPTRGHELTVPPPLHDYTRKPVKRRSTNERACMYDTYTHTHTQALHVYVGSAKGREKCRLVTERQRLAHTTEEDRDGRGGGRLAHQFPRSSGAQARHGSHTHTHTCARTRTTRHEHERDPCLTRLASVSSELSNGPVAFPALRASSPSFVIQSYVRTYVRTSVRTIDMCVTSSQPILIRRSFAVFAL